MDKPFFADIDKKFVHFGLIATITVPAIAPPIRTDVARIFCTGAHEVRCEAESPEPIKIPRGPMSEIQNISQVSSGTTAVTSAAPYSAFLR